MYSCLLPTSLKKVEDKKNRWMGDRDNGTYVCCRAKFAEEHSIENWGPITPILWRHFKQGGRCNKLLEGQHRWKTLWFAGQINCHSSWKTWLSLVPSSTLPMSVSVPWTVSWGGRATFNDPRPRLHIASGTTEIHGHYKAGILLSVWDPGHRHEKLLTQTLIQRNLTVLIWFSGTQELTDVRFIWVATMNKHAKK